jgi:hypothetical protein
MRYLIVLSLVALAACGTRVTESTGPDGRPAFTMRCPSDAGICYQEAAKRCPGGYEVIGSGQVGPANHPTLTVVCR